MPCKGRARATVKTYTLAAPAANRARSTNNGAGRHRVRTDNCGVIGSFSGLASRRQSAALGFYPRSRNLDGQGHRHYRVHQKQRMIGTLNFF